MGEVAALKARVARLEELVGAADDEMELSARFVKWCACDGQEWAKTAAPHASCSPPVACGG